MKALTTLLVVGMFLTTVAMADDVDDVKAAMQRSQVAANSGDTYAGTQIFLEEFTTFGPIGGLLRRFDSLEEQRTDLQARFESGVKYNRQVRHLEVTVYGNTGRLNNRITTVLVKQGGQWKIAHVHNSPLRLPQ